MKKSKNRGPEFATLKRVAARASKDKVFFNSLLRAPKTTLKNNDLKLSDADGKKLIAQVTKYRKMKRNLSVHPNRWTSPPPVNPPGWDL